MNTKKKQNLADEMGPVIFCYTREQAIEDGTLVDVSELASEAGFRLPVAVTAAVWHGWIEPPEAVADYQSATGRLWDLLQVLVFSIKKQAKETDRVDFKVLFQNRPGKQTTQAFYALCGPGDDGSPVITIMLPDED